jgi:hypothetical protein
VPRPVACASQVLVCLLRRAPPTCWGHPLGESNAHPLSFDFDQLAARSEGPEAAILAAVRPLGPVRSWVGLGVVRGVQLVGRWVRWPVTPTGTGAGSSAPPPYRRLAAGG